MQINETLSLVVAGARQVLGHQLKAIFLFGSGNNRDYLEGLSDSDFIFILDQIDYQTLKVIQALREHMKEKAQMGIDIKPFTLAELQAGIQGKGSFELFTGWGLYMLKTGKQRCLYNSGEVSLDFEVSEERIAADAFERAHYYVTKLRKLLATNDPMHRRGEVKVLQDADLLKVGASAVKNVLLFCLAYRGVLVDTWDEVLWQSGRAFGDVGPIRQLCRDRSGRTYSRGHLRQAYNRVEEIYRDAVVTNGAPEAEQNATRG